MFRDVCREVAKDFPDVALEDYHVDAMTAHLVRRARDFDVIVTENMFGDILSDLAGELVGSLGTAASLNASDSHAMGQAAHGAAPDISGHGIANPIAMIRSSAMLLEWLSERVNDESLIRGAANLEQGVAAVVEAGRTLTRDLGGRASTSEVTAAVVAAIERRVA
jgi:3-isopropylmalate dehydrogenase